MISAKFRWFLVTFLIAYPLDQITKRYVASNFYYGERHNVIPDFFDITYVRNPGAAFSLFADGAPEMRMLLFVGSGLIALVLLSVFLWRLPADDLLSAGAVGAIMGGALGNLTDRMTIGEVIDFLDVYLGSWTWPTFNVADSCIVVGVAVLILQIFLQPEESEEPEPSAGSVEA